MIILGKDFSHSLYEIFGAHINAQKGTVRFIVWAPNARSVSVIGDFNNWDRNSHKLNFHSNSGIWEGTFSNIVKGQLYKYCIYGQLGFYQEKADPFSFFSEIPPKTSSVVWDLTYEWHDHSWMENRKKYNSLSSPISIYEMHLGSWKRGEDNRWLNYRELAKHLVPYLKELNYTHVEILPVMEHPFYGSWGYQTTLYYAPTSRYGTPQDFMAFIDILHQNEIGVFLDWVPSHFPTDAYALSAFDGSSLFEHSNPKIGYHPEWGSFIFDYEKKEVRNFLISSAMFWLDKYHIDGLRVDAVASMLYLDYARKDGEWEPNQYGGKENINAITFLKELNEAIYKNFPDVQTIAEESSAWPMVTRPTSIGGLGFGLKWDMGWMHDTLNYFSKDPVHRKYHHNNLTFRMLYAYYENFILALSHDEVVYGKKSLIEKMPGDEWKKFANLRLLLAYMYAMPGKKLLFMGQEFAQRWEWNHESQLCWELLEMKNHKGVFKLISELNHLYRHKNALQDDFSQSAFEWLTVDDSESSVLVFLRKCPSSMILIACNFTPVPRIKYRIGVPFGKRWIKILDTDANEYGGSGFATLNYVEAVSENFLKFNYFIDIDIGPLSALFYEIERVGYE